VTAPRRARPPWCPRVARRLVTLLVMWAVWAMVIVGVNLSGVIDASVVLSLTHCRPASAHTTRCGGHTVDREAARVPGRRVP
jgi:hypothetical protein